MDKIRSLRIDEIKMPVVVDHAELDIGDDGRIDRLDSRVDTLSLELALRYRGGELKRGSHDGVFNYMELYEHLCFSPIRTLHGPLEVILDDTLERIEKQATADKIKLISACVSVQRLGLVVGAPELKSQRVYGPEPHLPANTYRSAGIAKVPLSVKVDHLWTKHPEHSRKRNQFPETVQLAFAAITPAHPLQPDSLEGLYNYIETYKHADSAQDMVVDGPFEIVAEEILTNVMRDAAHLKPVMLSVNITRAGYARCRPMIGVEMWG
ncbi:MAG: hypothetical protein ACAH83_10340 [Alphaproteobacteria bacterium]